MLVTLLVLTTVFFLLTVYNILQLNLGWFHISESKFWSLKILDSTSAATLFVTLVGALLVRHQFAASVLPRINYVSNVTNKENSLESGQSFKTWQVEIRNTGLGPAIIDRIEYFLELANDKEKPHHYKFITLIQKLTENNLVRDRDYILFNMSSGFSISPKDEYVVFEIKTEHLDKLNCLTMMLYFQGQLGDKYYREISLVGKSN